MSVTAAHPAGSVVVVRDEEWVVSSSEPRRRRMEGPLRRPDRARPRDDRHVLQQPGHDRGARSRRGRARPGHLPRLPPQPAVGRSGPPQDAGPAARARPDRRPATCCSTPLSTSVRPSRRHSTRHRLRPRLLIADAVGLGKTLEIGMTLAELQRRGRADRVLVVTPRHVLEQMQFELWTRFAIPLVRLDSEGIAKVRQQLPASRNPFTFFPKVIVSIDTLKSARYRAHLEHHRWDVVVIDEAHNLARSSTLNSQLARTIAPNTEALILASATPHNGDAESFANLVNLLDPTAIVDPSDYELQRHPAPLHPAPPQLPGGRSGGRHDVGQAAGPQVLPVRHHRRGRRRHRAVAGLAAPARGAAPRHRAGPAAVPVDPGQGVPVLALPPWLETVQNRQKTLADKGETPHSGGRGPGPAGRARRGARKRGLRQARRPRRAPAHASASARQRRPRRAVHRAARHAALAPAHAARRRSSLPEDAFAVLHGGLQDTEQLRGRRRIRPRGHVRSACCSPATSPARA